MAFGAGNGGTDGATPIAEINITPLTDVMLVLLIIAMVVAPTLVYKGAALVLPKVQKAQEFKQGDNLAEIDAQGQLYFNRQPIEESALADALKAKVAEAGQKEAVLIIAVDPSIAYQRVLDLYNTATTAEIEKVVLAGDVTDQYGRSLLHAKGNVPPTTAPAPESGTGGAEPVAKPATG